MKESLVVSDTEPIISLALIGRLDVLTSLFEDIIIPQVVWEELTDREDVPNLNQIKSFFKVVLKA
jgi:hypothetical protein